MSLAGDWQFNPYQMKLSGPTSPSSLSPPRGVCPESQASMRSSTPGCLLVALPAPAHPGTGPPTETSQNCLYSFYFPQWVASWCVSRGFWKFLSLLSHRVGWGDGTQEGRGPNVNSKSSTHLPRALRPTPGAGGRSGKSSQKASALLLHPGHASTGAPAAWCYHASGAAFWPRDAGCPHVQQGAGACGGM